VTILPDYLTPGLRVVFCGTAVSTASAARGHYYAGPGNEFWPLLHEAGLTPVLLTPDEDARVLEFALGLTGNRPGWENGLYQRMRDTLATERGRTLYARRKTTIEPVFGQIKYNRRIDRFMRRGGAAAQSEWRLVTATHNLRG
jgi:G:T/U-mismatch repair DNA glycosylase